MGVIIEKSFLDKIKNISSISFVVWHKGMEIYWDKDETPGVDENELSHQLGEFWFSHGEEFMYSGTMYLDPDMEYFTYEREDDNVSLFEDVTIDFCTTTLKSNITELSKLFGAQLDVDDLSLNIEFHSGDLVDCSVNNEKDGNKELKLEGNLRDKISAATKAYVSDEINESFVENMSLSIQYSWLSDIKEVTKDDYFFEIIDNQ
jgi:hypothetical protein